MPTFSLAALPAHLLEKVLTKVDETSYFRLQMANYGVYEFIRSSHNVSVQLDGHFILEYTSRWELRSSDSILTKIDLDGLYGVQLRTLYSPMFIGYGKKVSSPKAFQQLCEILKKNQITCRKMGILITTWTRDQCQEILKIVRPLKVRMESEGSRRYEALFHLKQLRTVDVRVDRDDVVEAMSRLLAKFPEVTIRVVYPTSDQRLKSLRTILQVLRSNPWPNLRKFRFISQRESSTLPTEDELKETFEGYDLEVQKSTEEKEGDKEIVVSLDMSKHNGICTFAVRNGYYSHVALVFVRNGIHSS